MSPSVRDEKHVCGMRNLFSTPFRHIGTAMFSVRLTDQFRQGKGGTKSYKRHYKCTLYPSDVVYKKLTESEHRRQQRNCAKCPSLTERVTKT